MIRELAGAKLVPPEKHFRWRGGELSRLEGFTDAVFALAVTLLIVSLEVPKTFSQLALMMKGFLSFAVCFALLANLWHRHYIYSRRYGLQTAHTVFLNSVLLFVVLFYVYPLKFLFALTLGGLSRTGGGDFGPAIELGQVPPLMTIFSLGYSAVFAVFALLYRYAYGKRRELELNPYEALRTRHEMMAHVVFSGVGLLVAVIAQLLPVRFSFFSVFLFGLSAAYRWVAKPILRKREKLALEQAQAAATATP